MVVQHNMNAINAYNRLNANVAGLKKASEKLASGYRINRAGDDAAGLAISEKMRSQIKGLNQAVRNSQDGINMIQTYEGAAQETHSILQRMKELAVESANGTYDNATDRAAIQLEFDQLNDELNQIADTDFNGTVVLNGGVMADGTVARNGEFRYAEGYTETVVADKATDISGDPAHTIADQSFYGKYEADAVWNQLGVDVNDVEKLNVTFMYDGERWVADTVTYAENKVDENGNTVYSKGDVVKGANAARLEARPVDRADASGKGGFEVVAGKDAYTSKDVVATNVIFNEMTPALKKGDTVTIQFDNSKATTYAPKNYGLDECFGGADVAFKMAADPTKPTFVPATLVDKVHFELSSGITDESMTKEISNALAELDKASIKASFTDGENKTFDYTDNAGTGLLEMDADTGAITLKSNGTLIGTVKIDDIKAVNPREDAKATGANRQANVAGTNTSAAGYTAGEIKAITDDQAKALAESVLQAAGTKDVASPAENTITFTWNATNSNWEVTGTNVTANKVMTSDEVAQAAGLANAAALFTMPFDNNGNQGFAAGTSFAIKYTQGKLSQEGADANFAGDVEFGINIKAYNYADMSGLTVHSVATPKAATMATQVATPGVSQANSFKNSTGVLTYTDNLTLQTGARTKDSVNFAFSYNTDGTADLGDLVSNLDLSSRSTGLNTASLSLADQKSANYAIDQIDKAINKTSMVRATFGSIQNRLEHKITNLTTTSENLTEAESSIRDTDMASEMMNYTKFNILQQAAQSMLAQANQQPQSILQLLG